jgi:hypothetical protein
MTALEEIKKALEGDMNTGLTAIDRLRFIVGGVPDFDPISVEDADWLISALECLQRENEKLRLFLFPYADRTDISGISWDGKYLIGDKASIAAFHEMKNRGEQIDTFKNAYEQSASVFRARAEEAVTAANALQVRTDAAEAEVKRLRNKVAARALTDAQLIDEVYAVDDVIDAGSGEGGGSPGEWWYERADELEHERKRRELESQIQQHNSRTALSSTGGEHHAE